MDWELKTTAWDFSMMGTDDDHDPRLGAFVGSSSLGPNNNGGNFSVDLQLGRLTDTTEDKGKVQKCPFNDSSPSGSSKRARGVSVAQSVTCMVDGCVADLNGCREYHRRHRVCERHSKTPVVSIAGKEQRFCQQCSRFQSLVEFDDEKRSCRKRLDGHNRRRRKPQPEAFYMNRGSSLSNRQGSRLLHFGCPEPYSSPVLTWPSVPNPPVGPHAPNSSVTVHNGEDKRFPFLLANETQMSSHHLANTNPNRVHSLLSSPRPIQMGPTGFNLGCPPHQLTRSPTLVAQDSSYGYSGNEVAVVSLSPDDLLEKGASQVLPFVWK